MRKTNFLRQGSVYAAGDLAERLIGLAMLPVYAYQLSVAEFGVLALVQTFTGLATTLLNLSLYTALVRHFYNPPEGATSRQVFGAAWGVLLVLPLAALLVLGTVGRPLLEALFTNVDFVPFIVMGLVTVYCNVAFIETAMALARTREEPVRYVAINVGRALLTTGLVLGFLFADDLDAEKVVGSQAAASAVVAVLCAAGMWRYSRPLADVGIATRLVRFSLPLVPLGASQWALRMQDRIVLDKYVDLAAIGVYAMAYRLASPLQILTQAGLRTIQPVLSQAAADPARKPAARHGIGQYLGVAFPVALLGMLLLPALTPVLLPDAYTQSGEVGQWVLASMLAMAVFQLAVNASALYRGKFASLTVVTLLGAACNITLNLLLIPEYGVTGAAVAAFATYTALALIGYFLSPLPELLRGLVGRLLLAVVLGGGCFAAGELLRPGGDLAAVAVAIVLSIGYGLCCYLLLMRDLGSHDPPPNGGRHRVHTSAA